jgi:glycerol-3-phosphate O-acyltransferase / dihydroxyacetone phosphate acyltransferase
LLNPLAAGLVLFGPIFIITARISKRKTAEALAASSVKIYGNDVMATWKILVAAGLAPLFYTCYTLLILGWNKCNHIYGYIPAGTPPWVIVLSSYTILSTITYASLLFGEEGLDILKSLYPLVLSLSPWSSQMVEALEEERRVLVLRVKEAVDQFGSEIFPDCEDISKWKGRGPKRLYAEISPEVDLEDLGGLDEFV